MQAQDGGKKTLDNCTKCFSDVNVIGYGGLLAMMELADLSADALGLLVRVISDTDYSYGHYTTGAGNASHVHSDKTGN